MHDTDAYRRVDAPDATHFFLCRTNTEALARFKRKLHASGVSWRESDWSEMAASEPGVTLIIALVTMPSRLSEFWAQRARVRSLSASNVVQSSGSTKR